MQQVRTLTRALTIGVAMAALSAAAPQGADAQTERHTLDGNAVAIYNLAGTVTIEGGSGPRVMVEVTRAGADASSLNVARTTVNGKPALVVRYPDGDVVYAADGRRSSSTSTMMVRSDGTFYGDGDRGRRITIRGSGSGTRAHADLRIIVPEGRSVDVRLGVGSVRATNVAGDLDIDVGAAGVDTRGTRGRLRVDTGSGRVTVADAEGDLLVDTGSGTVEVENVRGSAINIDTGSGAVRGTRLSADRILVDTGSGSVNLSGVAARDIEVDTGSGRVDVELTSDAERVLIDTGSGGVRLAVPEAFGATFDIESRNVAVDVPATFTRRERGHVTGSIGDGRGSVRIDTGSGRVSIVRN